MFDQCSTFLKLGLMVDVDGQGTAKITMIRRQGPKGHGQKDMQVDVFRYSKL